MLSAGRPSSRPHGTIHVLQELMGHSSITTTRGFYIHVNDANVRAATDRYEELVSRNTGRARIRSGDRGQSVAGEHGGLTDGY